MNGDALELAQMISSAESRLSTQINKVATEVAGMHGTFTTEIRSIKDDVQGVKDGIKDDKFWHNIKAYSGPVMVVVYGVAKKIGLPL